MKYLFLVLLSILLLSLTIQKVDAQITNGCDLIYGGGQTCQQTGNITVDKKIKHPIENRFLDQLTSDDPSFTPDQQITFTIDVKNTGRSTIKNITLEDLFPPQLIRYDDTVGKFDNKTKILNYPIEKLKGNEAKKITLKARVLKADQFPNNNDPVCLLNQVRAYTSRTKNNPSQDNVRFCLEKQAAAQQPQQTPSTSQGSPGGGLGQAKTPTPTKTQLPDQTKGGLPIKPQPNISKSPKTGPEALALIALLSSGLAGLLLRRKTK